MSMTSLNTPHKRPAMNRPLAAAAGLSFATLVVHVSLGTGEVLQPVLASDAPVVAREVVRACWHLITLTLFAMTAAYCYGLRRRTTALILTWSLLAAAFGIVFAIVAIQSGLGFGAVPQSIAFFAITVTGFAGLRRSLYLHDEPAMPHRAAGRTIQAVPDSSEASLSTAR